MHYVVFLMGKGMAPYRDILDMNLPGTYAVEWAVMHILGTGALAWRAWDFILLSLVVLSMTALVGSRSRVGALIAGALFALLHLQDGLPDAGQRDFLVTALLLSGTAAINMILRGEYKGKWLVTAGLLFGTAVTVKPIAAPLGIMLLSLACYLLWRRGRPLVSPTLAAVSGFFIPLLAATVFLLWWHSAPAFWWVVTRLIPFDASLGRRSFSYFAVHGFAPVQPLCYLAVLLAALLLDCKLPKSEAPAGAATDVPQGSSWIDRHWLALVLSLGVLCGFISYLVQGKGYPYHRYPLLAFSLLGWALLSERALQVQTSQKALKRIASAFAAFGYVYAAFFVAPIAMHKATHYDGENQFEALLANDLKSLGGAALSGKVQCIDMSAGCLKTLWTLRLPQSTGMLYEYTILAPGTNPAELQVRESFLKQILARPPKVFVVTDQDYLFGNTGYRKLDRWPALSSFISSNYSLWVERRPASSVRWEPRTVPPAGYRIYKLHESQKL